MTTIVVVRKGDAAVIAAYRDSFIGVAGSAAHQLVLENLLERKPTLDFHGKAAIYETFRKLHPVLKDEAFLNPKEEDDDPYESSQMTVMIANPSGIYAVYENTADATTIAMAGVLAGAEFDTGTALPIHHHEVKLE